MSQDVPELPSERAPEGAAPELGQPPEQDGETEAPTPAAAEDAEGGSPATASAEGGVSAAVPETADEPSANRDSAAASGGGAPPPPAAAVPGLPGMPGEASANEAEADEDDDFEIPEDVGYEQIVKGGATPERSRKDAPPSIIQGKVVGKRPDGVFVDIGQKAEAFLAVAPSSEAAESLDVGSTVEVIVTGHSPEGYPLLASFTSQRPQGWQQLEAAYRAGGTVLGKVTGTIKGGLSVDVGVRAFMPASRSGAFNDSGLQALVGQEIRVKILQFDEADRNVVLDRRSVLDAERAKNREELLSKVRIGDRVTGTVRTLLKFGAFVDLGGIDGLLHVSDIAWQRVNDPADFLHRGQEIEVEIVKVDREAQRIGVGLKQLQPEPWTTLGDQVKVNDRIRGKVMRIKDYGAFVEVIPGIEGLVRISDMSYARRVRHPSEIVSVGEVVEVMVLDIKADQKRIALGLKQALGDPWETIAELHPAGSVITRTVRKITSFGAFVEVVAGVDGLLHISDITSERRLNSPSEVLKEGQEVRVKVLDIDLERRRIKLSMKELEPTEMDQFLSQVEVGETITGRVIEADARQAIVEIGDGVRGVCAIEAQSAPRKDESEGQTSDTSELGAMLESAWKGGSAGEESAGGPAVLTAGSVHSFKITRLDATNGTIELSQA